MTPAEYDRHKEWLQGQIAFTLDRLRSMWAIRDHYIITPDMLRDLVDLRDRLQWMIDRHCADAASISTAAPRCGRSTGGSVPRIRSSRVRDSQTADGQTRSPAAVT